MREVKKNAAADKKTLANLFSF